MTTETTTNRARAQRRESDAKGQRCNGVACARSDDRRFPVERSGHHASRRVRVRLDVTWPTSGPPPEIGVRWLLKKLLRTYRAKCCFVEVLYPDAPNDPPSEPVSLFDEPTDPQGRNDDQA